VKIYLIEFCLPQGAFDSNHFKLMFYLCPKNVN
jgi:hypothetical protein